MHKTAITSLTQQETVIAIANKTRNGCRHYNPARYINPYPTETITPNDIKLDGIPLVKKWRTFRYRWPVWGTSVMMAAIFISLIQR